MVPTFKIEHLSRQPDLLQNSQGYTLLDGSVSGFNFNFVIFVFLGDILSQNNIQ